MSTFSAVLASRNITNKIIERRVMQIREDDINRFVLEINMLRPFYEQLVFLDEMSLDNRSLLRKKGWCFRNEKLVYQGTFVRSKRISLLAFMGALGVLEVFREFGTFSRQKFLNCARTLLLSGKISKWPGPGSLWILDGATIHVSEQLIGYFWAMGIKVIFLPAYCPFYNPIEILFGLVKRWCRKQEVERGKEPDFVMSGFEHYHAYDFTKIFRHCGYGSAGHFNPYINFKKVESLAGFFSTYDDEAIEIEE
jgi:hypothetical protein